MSDDRWPPKTADVNRAFNENASGRAQDGYKSPEAEAAKAAEKQRAAREELEMLEKQRSKPAPQHNMPLPPGQDAHDARRQAEEARERRIAELRNKAKAEDLEIQKDDGRAR